MCRTGLHKYHAFQLSLGSPGWPRPFYVWKNATNPAAHDPRCRQKVGLRVRSGVEAVSTDVQGCTWPQTTDTILCRLVLHITGLALIYVRGEGNKRLHKPDALSHFILPLDY